MKITNIVNLNGSEYACSTWMSKQRRPMATNVVWRFCGDAAPERLEPLLAAAFIPTYLRNQLVSNVEWSQRTRQLRVILAAGVVAMLGACSSGSDNGGTDPQPDFAFSIAPSTLSVQQGASGTITASISRTGGFTGAITGSAEGLPAGVTLSAISFAPGTTSATVTVSVAATAATGTSAVVIRAQGAGVTAKQTTLSVTVTAAPIPAATISVNPSALSVQAGASGTSQATVTRSGGFAGALALAATGAPAGMTVTAPAVAAGSTTSAITVNVGAGVAPGAYPVTLTASGTGITAPTATLTVTVTAAPVPAATIALNPTSVTIAAGASGTSQATITRSGGFAGAVTITSSGAPAGMTVAAPAIAAGATTSTVTVTVGASVAAGAYPITVRANATGITEVTAELTVTVSAAPGFAVTLNPTALTVAPGAQGTSAINIARTGGFTGALTFALQGNPPAGVVLTLPSGPVTAATSQITVSVGATVAAGSYPLTINVTGTGVPASTVTLTLTVPSVGGLSLAVSPATVSVTQGQSSQATITVTRVAPLVAAAQITVSGLPNGVTATVNPNPITGTTATVTFTAAAGATVGNVNATISGAGGGVTSAPVTLPITVAASGGGGGSGNVTYNFCSISGLPAFVAYQDGNGPWVRATAGANNSYSFNIASGRGGVAYVVTSGIGSDMDVEFGSVAELNGFGSDDCDGTTNTGRTFTGTVAGAGPTDFVSIVAGGAFTQVVTAASPNFTIENVANGPFDLLATRFSLLGGAGKFFIRRNLNPPNNSALPTIDFNSADAFDPVQRSLTINNSLGQDLTSTGLYVLQGGSGGAVYFADFGASSATSRPWFGVPDAKRAPGDFHVLSVIALSPQNNQDTRSISRVFREATDQTLTLPAVLGATNITSLGASGGNARLRASYTKQADYGNLWVAGYSQSAASITILATSNYFTGPTVELDVPDLAGLAGWNPAWGLSSGANTIWTFSASGFSTFGNGVPSVADGALSRSATRNGNVTP